MIRLEHADLPRGLRAFVTGAAGTLGARIVRGVFKTL
jgi:hypothetical protein